jgi:repressor LexA
MQVLTEKQTQILEFIRNSQLKNNFSPTFREIMNYFKFKAIASVQDHLSALERKGYIKKDRSKARSIEIIGIKKILRDIVEVPIVGTVAAGKPLLAVENIEGYIALDRRWAKSDNVFALKVHGDSMVGASILDGDYAIVKQQSVADNGEVVVALIEDEATVKRFFKEKDKVILKPENEQMMPIIIRKDTKNLQLIGKVIGIYRGL